MVHNDYHIHLIFRSIKGQRPELLLGDFKRFTSKAIVQAIIDNPQETSIEPLEGNAIPNRRTRTFFQIDTK